MVRFEGYLSFLRFLFEALISFVAVINNCGTIGYFLGIIDLLGMPIFAL